MDEQTKAPTASARPVDPILLPASLPGLLRAGLPVRVKWGAGDGEVGPVRVLCSVEESPTDGELWCNIAGTRVGHPVVDDYPLAELRLDLRDPSVRDHVVRALWARLRPDEPEPLTAPWFQVGTGDGVLLWWLTWDDGGICRSTAPAVVPGGVKVGEPEARLLALACVAAHVLGGAR